MASVAAMLSAAFLMAQDPVVGSPDPESLFTSKDPKLNTNKQAAMHIVRDLLEAGHWDEAPKWDRKSWATKVVSVVAEGDLVTVGIVRECVDPRTPGKTYTTTWFDMWRFVDGKADEHWDFGTIAGQGNAPDCARAAAPAK